MGARGDSAPGGTFECGLSKLIGWALRMECGHQTLCYAFLWRLGHCMPLSRNFASIVEPIWTGISLHHILTNKLPLGLGLENGSLAMSLIDDAHYNILISEAQLLPAVSPSSTKRYHRRVSVEEYIACRQFRFSACSYVVQAAFYTSSHYFLVATGPQSAQPHLHDR